MKILLVTKKFPYPLTEGEPIAINYLAKSLVALGCQVDLLVMNTSKHFFDPKDLPSKANFFREIHSVKVNNHITILGGLKSLLLGKSYILDRFESSEFAERVAFLLSENKYDVVQFETIYLAHYTNVVRRNSGAVLALRAHNVEHEIWERVAANSNALKKWYLHHQNRRLKKFESTSLNSFDIILAITNRDLSAFRQMGCHRPAIEVPVGITLSEYPIDQVQTVPPKTACFIGALDWMPNQHGLNWFLEKIWPGLAAKFPGAMFNIAGKNTPASIHDKANAQVNVHGEVPDAKAFICQNRVLVAPLFSGSGIKIKVLEGMALGRTVVTTSIGAEGIPALHGKHLLIADSKEEFTNQVAWCFENPTEAESIGLNAREFIRNNFENLRIAENVITAYKKLVSC